MGNCNALSNQTISSKQKSPVNHNKRTITNPNEQLPIVLKQKQNTIQCISHVNTTELHFNFSSIKYTKNDKEAQINYIKNSESQTGLAEVLQKLNVDLLEKSSKQDINLNCFVKCFKLENNSSQKTDEELLVYFQEIKENLVNGFKTSIKEDKAKILDDYHEFSNYRTNFENDKAKVRSLIQIVKEYKDQMVFQILTNHTSVFSELSMKLLKEKRLDYFGEIRSAMVKLHGYYFDIIECKDKERLEKIYHAYLNEEYNLFCLFYNSQPDVSQVVYTEYKLTEKQTEHK